MDIEHLASRMAQHAACIRGLADGITAEQARVKPTSDSWSVLEVVNHLWDEEREDFRVRIDYTLHRPGEPWPGINPGSWVTERLYNERDLAESLDGFLSCRETSLAWLRGLTASDWETTAQTPWGSITAGDLFAAWVTHDLLHIRQLVELRWALLQAELAPRDTRYAGQW
jgi:DinB superfamily